MGAGGEGGREKKNRGRKRAVYLNVGVAWVGSSPLSATSLLLAVGIELRAS